MAKVKDCGKCGLLQRKRWTHVYFPNNYHPIGMAHAYAYCNGYECRVSEIKGKCKIVTCAIYQNDGTVLCKE